MAKCGTLNDTAIAECARAGKLIIDNFKPENVKQACYELRASSTYYQPLLTSGEKHVAKAGEYILIKPKHVVVIITEERIELPKDMLARVLTKGKLFSIGLSAVNTYADPGFTGKLGIVLFNMSTKYIKITPGQSIAKIEFSKLESEVARGYTGQHGYESEIWPIPTDHILTEAEILKDARISDTIEEVALIHGQEIGDIVNKIFWFERKLLLFSFISITCLCVMLLVILRYSDEPNKYYIIITNLWTAIIGGTITSIAIHVATSTKSIKRFIWKLLRQFSGSVNLIETITGYLHPAT